MSLTLPARYYVDPSIYREESVAIFGTMWICLGRTEEIARPGSYITREVAGESLILTRGDDQAVRAFHNVCRHRGTRICEASEGQAGHRLQCPYHAWTWDLQGKLVAAPHMEGTAGFDKENYPLFQAKAAEWDGLLFANLDANAPPLESQLEDLRTKFRPWGMVGLERGSRIVYDVKANWKLIIQNYSECLHCPVIHPALAKLSHYLSGVNEPGGVGSAYLGGRMDLRVGVDSMSMDGRRVGGFLPGLNLEERSKVLYYAVLPNLLLSLHPDYVMTHVLRPLAENRTEVVCEWHFPPSTLADPAFNPAPAVEFWDLTNRQDWHVSELSQLGIGSKAYRPGPYSPREELLHAFDSWLLGRLGDATQEDGGVPVAGLRKAGEPYLTPNFEEAKR